MRNAQGELCLLDEQTPEQEREGELKTRFLDGKQYNVEHIEVLRQRLAAQQ
jgi:nicotinamide phosphoribosyltransferase